MKKNIEIHENFAGEALRWALIALGAAVAILLAATLETGRAHASAGAFAFKGALNRVITPNDDGNNDTAVLCFDNPKDSGVSGKIYDLRGQYVADMTQVATTNTLANTAVRWCNQLYPGQFKPQAVTWDAKVGGAAVAGGVYIYRVEAEQGAYTGTLLVVR
ncbi:MAG: hypothetical protein KGL53_00535 [Elusimicrobia bacterium]|nr:hypothetical protein [Elusimicrobiota bacterium]